MNEDMACSSSGDDATPAFLFKSECGKFLAVSLQRNGENIPNDDQQNWILESEFPLGVHEAIPVRARQLSLKVPLARTPSARGRRL